MAAAADARPDSAAQGDDGNKDAADEKMQQQEQIEEQKEEGGGGQEESRKVHEVTESSSDESSDDTSTSRSLQSMNSSTTGAEAVTVEEDDDEEEEEEEEEEKMVEMPAPEVVAKMRAGVYMPDPEVVYNTKNVADMHYLFTNDKLKEESPAIVLRSDPFCIPRVTDNVPNYRPTLNPLSIFLGEDQLLPGNFRLDPTETLPNAAGNVKQDGKSGPRGMLPAPPGSSSSSTGTGKQFRGKTSAFMGTMPRQTEFAEIPVSEKLFQNHEVFRPSPPIPRAPSSPSRDQRTANSTTTTRQFTASNSEGDQTPMSAAPGAGSTTPASLSDAMLLSSIQHTLDVTTAALAATDSTVSSVDGAPDSASSITEGAPASSGYQIQQLQPLESVADTLTNYLPNRATSMPDNSRHMDGQVFNAPGGYNPVNMSMGYATAAPGVPGTFGSLLSPVETQANAQYPGLFVDSGETQSSNQSMQTFSSALGSISITTPTNGAVGIHTGLITPQGGATSSNGGTPRRPGAKKPRAKNVFRPCTAPGCTKGARGKSGLCQKHGGGKRCATPNCPKGAQGSSNMCLFHGGGYRCTVEGCSTGARGTSGLCAKHGGYKKGKVGSAGKRATGADGAAAKRVRTDEPEPHNAVKAE